MALLFMEGFEHYEVGDADHGTLAEDDRLVEYYSLGNNYQITATTSPRIDGAYIRNYSSQGRLVYRLSAESTDTYYAGFAFNNAGATSNGSPIFLFQYESIGNYYDQNCVTVGSGKTLSVRRGGAGGTILGTTTGVISNTGWNYIVIKIKCSNTVGTVELWLNDVKELDLTGLDTQAATSISTVSAIKLTGYGAAYEHFDDIYVGDTSGTDMTDQVGDCHIELLRPNANGNRNDFTASPAVANYLNVDETNGSDQDTTYNHSSTVADGELYATGSIVGSVSNVYGVQAYATVKKIDPGGRTGNIICRSSTTEVDSAAFGLTTDYRTHAEIYENDPNGGINWTETTANNAEIGFEIAT